MQKYLMGFVVGYELPNVAGDNKFYLEKNVAKYTVVRGKKIWRNEVELQIFKDPDSARQRAELGQSVSNQKYPTNTAQWFWRAYMYETDNPKNAKGMPTWEPHDNLWHWVNPRTQVVEVPPDPAVLMQALAHVR